MTPEPLDSSPLRPGVESEARHHFTTRGFRGSNSDQLLGPIADRSGADCRSVDC